jgi:alkylation response protein AidB-like acyl-CoA dehydrogenase
MITIEQEEHAELRATVRKVIQRESPVTNVMPDEVERTGYDSALWRRLATEIGVAGLTIPERFGGAGVTIAEQAVVAEEFGRELVCTPALATVGLAVTTLLASGHVEAQESWLPRIAAGEITASVVYRGEGGEVAADNTAVRAARTPNGWTLSGRARFVLDGHTAHVLLVLGDSGASGPELFLVSGEALGLERHRMRTLDPTRPIGEVIFNRTPAERLATGARAWGSVEHALDVSTVLLAAEQQGGAQRLLEMSVDYAGTRFQFGRSIASFQAIKHRCADLAVAVDRGRSAVMHSTWAASEPEGNAWLRSAAATAALVCGRTYDWAAAENVQIHGGIGFSWEHPAHLYFRRAKSDLALLATEIYYTDRLLTAVGA